MAYADIAELRALDGMEDSGLFSDALLSEAIDFAVETVEVYCGQKWDTVDNPTPEIIRWCVRTIARQYVLDTVSRIPDRALQLQSEFGSIQLAQAGGSFRPTSLPEVNAKLNLYRARLPFIFM
ncbi:head-to-tail adaptor [Streptomyces phage RemusLoopin]|uniref:Head-to-tail adaptor n=1 Tax=Streptomyces phage RemusLoopin TaxID=2562346 RepID=A0A4D6E3T3_9CAUD|nr:head-to-tail adaptor [Streptomyces phage RemusLoopin]